MIHRTRIYGVGAFPGRFSRAGQSRVAQDGVYIALFRSLEQGRGFRSKIAKYTPSYTSYIDSAIVQTHTATLDARTPDVPALAFCSFH